MSKRTALPVRIAPLQRVVAEPITDPAEQTALDRLRKREKEDRQPRKEKWAALVLRRRKQHDSQWRCQMTVSPGTHGFHSSRVSRMGRSEGSQRHGQS